MLRNLSKRENICNKVKLCNNIFCKSIGFMFSKKDEDLALIFEFSYEKIVPLHMFFVFYSIDVLFLDEDKKVVEIKRDFKPFCYYHPFRNSKFVIELVAGKASNVEISDKLNW